MLTIVDFGVGNLGSIENMLKKIGCESRISSDPDVIASASKIILPGVGAFDQGMRSLRERNLEGILRVKALEERIPILGICLGMQMLGHASEEGVEPGLGWIDARCKRFGGEGWDTKLKVPHMGWNTIRHPRDNPLLAGLPDLPRFYFVHSYHLVCSDESIVSGITQYGIAFTSMVQSRNICGVQFHPEKSHRFGLALFRNFVEGSGKC